MIIICRTRGTTKSVVEAQRGAVLLQCPLSFLVCVRACCCPFYTDVRTEKSYVERERGGDGGKVAIRFPFAATTTTKNKQKKTDKEKKVRERIVNIKGRNNNNTNKVTYFSPVTGLFSSQTMSLTWLILRSAGWRWKESEVFSRETAFSS